MTLNIFLVLIVIVPILSVLVNIVYAYSNSKNWSDVDPFQVRFPIGFGAIAYLFWMYLSYTTVDNKYSYYKSNFHIPDSVIAERITALKTTESLSLSSRINSSLLWHQTLLNVKLDSVKYRLQEEAEFAKLDAKHPLSWWQIILLAVVNMLFLPHVVYFCLSILKSGDTSEKIKQLTKQLYIPAHEVHPLIPFWKEGDTVQCLGYEYLDISYLSTKDYREVLDMNASCEYFHLTKMKFVSFSEKGILVHDDKEGAKHIPSYFVRKNITFDIERKKDVLKKMDEDSLYNVKLRILAEETYGQKV